MPNNHAPSLSDRLYEELHIIIAVVEVGEPDSKVQDFEGIAEAPHGNASTRLMTGVSSL